MGKEDDPNEGSEKFKEFVKDLSRRGPLSPFEREYTKAEKERLLKLPHDQWPIGFNPFRLASDE